ncbi:MAG TPA: glycosyltransferase [Trebonia sp.]
MSEIPEVDIVVPVKNEAHALAPSVTRLVAYLREYFPLTARVTIADNGSTDGTGLVARSLAEAFPEVKAVHRGRGCFPR